MAGDKPADAAVPWNCRSCWKDRVTCHTDVMRSGLPLDSRI
jgi:hypothetical protein